MNSNDAARLGLEQGDWVWIESPWGKVREVLDLYYGISKGVANANHAWWFLEMDTASHGYELVNINCVMDPYGQDVVGGAATMRSVPACWCTRRPRELATRQPGAVRPAGQSVHLRRERPAVEGMDGNGATFPR